MPKPQGTYLQMQQTERARLRAAANRQRVTVPRVQELAAFQRFLDQLDERRLEQWRFEALQIQAELDALGKGKAPETIPAKLGELAGNVAKVLEKFEDLDHFHMGMQQPTQVVLHAAYHPDGASSLVLIIALLQVIEVLIKLYRGRRHSA